MTQPVMIGVSGIRGIVGEGFSPELIVQFASAAGTLFGPGRVLVGRDTRLSGRMALHGVFSGLMAVGCSPIDLGICATPTVEIAVRDSDAVGGVIITASHNPVEWNALKLVGPDGLFLDAEAGTRLRDIIQAKAYAFRPWDGLGQEGEYPNATADHIAHLLRLPFLDVPSLQKRGFTVVCDCVNGAGSVIAPSLLETLGCRVILLHAEPTGRFARPPEPIPEHLGDLCDRVRAEHADIGFALDPDADRLAIVDETGTPIGEEYTLALAVRFVLSQRVGPVVVNASTSRVIDEIAADYGAPVIRTPVGEIHVSKAMQKVQAVIGGEGNGGVILPDNHLGRDGLLAMVLTLQHLLVSGKTVSALWKAQPQYVMVKKKITIGKTDPDRLLAGLEALHRDEPIDKTDGLKIGWERGWVQIRKSNTEPIFRVMAEAPSREEAEAWADRILDEIARL